MRKRILCALLALILLCGSAFEAIPLQNTALASEADGDLFDIIPEEETPLPTETPEPTDAPTTLPPSDDALSPAPDFTVEPTEAPADTATPANPENSGTKTSAPAENTKIPEVIPTRKPAEESTPAVTAPPLPAERMAAGLGLSIEELAACLGLSVEELFMMNEEMLEARRLLVYAGGDSAVTSELADPDFIVEGGVLLRCESPETELSIPGDLGIAAIGPGAFQDNIALRSVILPNGVKEIGDSAFAGCTAMERVSLPDSLLRIGQASFSGCVSLAEIALPASLTELGARAFEGCPELTIQVAESSPAQDLCAAAGYRYIIEGRPTEDLLSEAESVLVLSSAAFNVPSLTLAEGQSSTLSVVLPADAAVAYTLTAENDKISVEQSGEIVALRRGESKVFAVTGDGRTIAECPVTILPTPASLTLSQTTAALGAKETLTLVPSVDPGAQTNFTFKSSKTSVATVNAAGLITARKAGKATITVTTHNGLTATCDVTVKAAPKKVTLSPAKLTLGAGASKQLQATITSGSASRLAFSSNNRVVADVDPDTGIIFAREAGTATITATALANGKKAICTVTVKPEPEDVTFTSVPDRLGAGESFTLAAVDSESAGDVRFSIVSGGECAALDGTKLTAGRPGDVTVRATAYNGKVHRDKVIHILPAPTSITLDETTIYLGVKESLTDALHVHVSEGSADSFTYRSTNAKIFKVDAATGKLTGVKKGTAYVYATTYNGLETGRCKVIVQAAPSKVTISVPYRTISVGMTMAPTLTPAGGTASCTLTSSDTGVIAIDDGNVLRAVGVGQSSITAIAFNKRKSAAITINVVDEPGAVYAAKDIYTITEGLTTQVAFEVPDSVTAYTYASSDPEIAYIDEHGDGTVTGVSAGTATITATTHNGHSAKTTVVVLPIPESLIPLDQTNVTLGVKETFTLTPSAGEDDLTFTSSKTSVATVSAAGVITARKAGKATITVRSDSGLTATCAVTVKAAPKKVTLSPAKLTIGAGDSAQLTAKLTAASSASKLTYSSDNTEVADVDPSTGLITAKSYGIAIITAETFNGIKGYCTVTVKREPAYVTFTSIPEKIGAGDSCTLAAEVDSESIGAVRFSIVKGDEYAALDGAKLTASKPGDVTVRATAYNNTVYRDEVIHVVPAPTSITLDETAINLGVKEDLADALHAHVSEGSADSFTYKSTNTNIFKVDANTGKLTGVKKGTAYVYATTYNGLETERCKVVVQAAPSKVAIFVPRTTISVGMTMTPMFKLTGGASACTLESSAPSTIAVEKGNTLRAVDVGQSSITAITFNKKKSAAVTINVVDEPGEICAAEERYTVAEGLTAQVVFEVPGSVTEYTYESSDPEIASIEPDGDGTVTGVSAGTATITATTHNGLTAKTTVEVLPAPKSLTPEVFTLTLGVGQTYKFAFSPVPENALAAYSYMSSNTSVAAVDANGTISAMARGTALITVASHNGASAHLQINVVNYRDEHPAYMMAHRGASAYRQENTIAAFQYAVELGAEMIELDVRRTADDQIVVFHDAVIKVSKKSSKAISSLTLSQIKEIDANIVTLQEALAYISQTPVELMIEFKVTGIEQQVIDIIEQSDMRSRIICASGTLSIIEKIKALRPSYFVSYNLRTSAELNKVIKNASSYDIDMVFVKHTQLSAVQVRSAHLLGLEVAVWTVVSAADIQKMADLGVNGICTDYPDRRYK